jgi:hypothetical protein
VNEENRVNHLDFLDQDVHTGIFLRAFRKGILYDKPKLREKFIPILYQTIITQVWRMEELRWPVIMYVAIFHILNGASDDTAEWKRVAITLINYLRRWRTRRDCA